MPKESDRPLIDQWVSAVPNPGAPTPIAFKRFSPHAVAVLHGYAHTQPKEPLPTQVLDYSTNGVRHIFKVGVWDDAGDVWHLFLLMQPTSDEDFEVRYGGKKPKSRGSALGPPSLPNGESLKALGMAEVQYQKPKQGSFRFDCHFCTIASVMGIANLVARENDILTTIQKRQDGFWPHVLMCSQPVQLMDDALPERFLQYMPQTGPAPVVVELQRTDCDVQAKMVVYKKDSYWRAQYLERIQCLFPD